ncbi:hypothetical protein C5167_049330 [Papaver somniferum]|uniref:Uncharacterized protein n=1 Tax=Papaver somniferum TaxID=3469 RepID=A0A4Y7KKI5_PAPSO|nr:hypothetical protein C5167_049330 [Papaver somniferum]
MGTLGSGLLCAVVGEGILVIKPIADALACMLIDKRDLDDDQKRYRKERQRGKEKEACNELLGTITSHVTIRRMKIIPG